MRCLLKSGCDPTLRNKSGSAPFHLAVQNTGRGGAGSEEATSRTTPDHRRPACEQGSTALEDGKGRSVLDSSPRSGRIRICSPRMPPTDMGHCFFSASLGGFYSSSLSSFFKRRSKPGSGTANQESRPCPPTSRTIQSSTTPSRSRARGDDSRLVELLVVLGIIAAPDRTSVTGRSYAQGLPHAAPNASTT